MDVEKEKAKKILDGLWPLNKRNAEHNIKIITDGLREWEAQVFKRIEKILKRQKANRVINLDYVDDEKVFCFEAELAESNWEGSTLQEAVEKAEEETK